MDLNIIVNDPTRTAAGDSASILHNFNSTGPRAPLDRRYNETDREVMDGDDKARICRYGWKCGTA